MITSLATVTYWGSKKLSSRTFALTMYVVAAYTAIIAVSLFLNNYRLEAIGIRLTFFLGTIIAILIFVFIKTFEKEAFPNGWLLSLLVLIAGASFYCLFFTDYIAGNPIALKNMPSGVLWGWQYGQYSLAFFLVNLGIYVAGTIVLIRMFVRNTDKALRGNIILNIVGLLVGVTSGIICNSILPQMGNYDWTWLGPTSGIIWVSIIAYSIFRYNQMRIKIVITEVLVIAMSLAAFVNIFVGDFLGVYGKIFIFLAFSGLGIYLIKSAVREDEQSEQLADLNKHLQEKVEEQTKEIRASYQVERSARLELEKIDEAKNQFILITQHHLRTPITSIKWQLESLMSDSYGVVSPELKRAMGDMSESVGRLNHLIDNLLSISALRSGIEQLKKASVSIKTIVDEILTELKKDIDRKHLTINIPTTNEDWPNVPIDKDRMREALFIIIENAVRYNFDNGSIKIAAHATENTFEMSVENTGAELSPDDKKKIFSELFYRSSQAQTSHPTGMGIGLSMAQAIIEAHNGTISLGSRREVGGVRVVITLPY